MRGRMRGRMKKLLSILIILTTLLALLAIPGIFRVSVQMNVPPFGFSTNPVDGWVVYAFNFRGHTLAFEKDGVFVYE